MTASVATPPAARQTFDRLPIARRVVAGLIALTLLMGAALLAASFVPSATLAGRLINTAAEGRGGAFTQDLVTHFGERLRFAAAALLTLAAALIAVRRPAGQIVEAAIQDARSGARHGLPITRAELALLGVMTLTALAIRLIFINQPMRYDEALTFNEFASRPLYYGLSFYPDPNNHLLNTLLMHVSVVLFGNQPWALRLPALLAGVLLVPATFALTRILYGPRAAVLAGAVVAASSYLVEYSTNGRGYTWQALCFVACFALATTALERDSPSALLLAALSAAVGAYALPTMLYGVAIVAVWGGLRFRSLRPPRLRPGHFLAAGALLGLAVTLLYLPVLIVSGPDRLAGNRFVVPLDLADLSTELPRSLARTWAFWNRDVPWPLSGLLVLGFVIASVGDLRARRFPLGVLAPLVCLVMVVAQRVAPFERVWLFLLPLYVTIASAGLTRFVDGRLVGLVLGAGLGFLTVTNGSVLASPETGAFPDADAVARALDGRLATDDAVVTQIPASLPELQYYFPRHGLSIETLVRPPQQAARLYVVATPGVEPDVPGWGSAREVARLSGSTIDELSRVAS